MRHHPSEVVVRGEGARADAPGDASVDSPSASRRAGAMPAERDEGGHSPGRPGPRHHGVVVVGGAAKWTAERACQIRQ